MKRTETAPCPPPGPPGHWPLTRPVWAYLRCSREEQAIDGVSLRSRAERVWTTAGLTPLGFREARHTYASLMIAASVNVKALATYMGHSSISTTLVYGRLFPGNESDAAALLDAYLVGE